MKNILLISCLLFNGTVFAASSFYCQLSKNDSYYNSNYYTIATIKGTQMKLDSVEYNPSMPQG